MTLFAQLASVPYSFHNHAACWQAGQQHVQQPVAPGTGTCTMRPACPNGCLLPANKHWQRRSTPSWQELLCWGGSDIHYSCSPVAAAAAALLQLVPILPFVSMCCAFAYLCIAPCNPCIPCIPNPTWHVWLSGCFQWGLSRGLHTHTDKLGVARHTSVLCILARGNSHSCTAPCIPACGLV